MFSQKEQMSNHRPIDWNDDVKMTVMFSPFRERNLNPKGWEQKVKFWSEVILTDCLACRRSLISVAELRETFRRKEKMPACLQTVIQDMLSKGDLKKLSDMEQKSSDGWLSWGFKKLVQEPVGWSLKVLPWQQSSTKSCETEETFVVMDVIKDKGREVIERHTSRVNEAHSDIVEYSDLQKQYTDLFMNETEFSLVLQYLHNTKQVVIQQVDKDKKLVKFVHKEETDSKKIIEEKDIHIHKIQLAKDALKKQIKLTSAEVNSLGSEALSYKTQGQKSLAMSCMRKRKLAQKREEKLTGSLDTLEGILYGIKQAESNEMVLRAIEGGTSILKDLSGKTTAEEATEIMDNLADVSQSQDELTTELGIRMGVDEPSISELEDELNDIMQDGVANNSVTRSNKLPTSPLVSPKANKGRDIDEDLEKELADILKEDNPKTKDIPLDSSLLDMLDDLQLPEVPTHSPSKEGRPKKQQAVYT